MNGELQLATARKTFIDGVKLTTQQKDVAFNSLDQCVKSKPQIPAEIDVQSDELPVNLIKQIQSCKFEFFLQMLMKFKTYIRSLKSQYLTPYLNIKKKNTIRKTQIVNDVDNALLFTCASWSPRYPITPN